MGVFHSGGLVRVQVWVGCHYVFPWDDLVTLLSVWSLRESTGGASGQLDCLVGIDYLCGCSLVQPDMEFPVSSGEVGGFSQFGFLGSIPLCGICLNSQWSGWFLGYFRPLLFTVRALCISGCRLLRRRLELL